MYVIELFSARLSPVMLSYSTLVLGNKLQWNLIEMHIFSFKKVIYNMLSEKCVPLCSGRGMFKEDMLSMGTSLLIIADLLPYDWKTNINDDHNHSEIMSNWLSVCNINQESSRVGIAMFCKFWCCNYHLQLSPNFCIPDFFPCRAKQIQNYTSLSYQ